MAAEGECARSGAAYCNDPRVQSYANLFRARYASVEAGLEAQLSAAEAASDSPPPVIYGDEIEWTEENEREYQAALARSARASAPVRTYGPPAPATDQQVTQAVVDRTNLTNTTSLSPQAQAARARNQFASARNSRVQVGVYPTPMTERRQLATVLTTRASQDWVGTAGKVALAASLTLGVIGLVSLFGPKR
jgi:hypothetical protein